MAPRKKVDCVILSLLYSDCESPEFIRISHDWHTSRSPIAELESDWFQRVDRQENFQRPNNMQVRYCDWRFISGEESIFIVNDQLYEQIFIIIGEESTYWLYSQKMSPYQRIEGNAKIPLTYCPCCLSNQFSQIICILRNYLEHEHFKVCHCY